MTSCYGPPPRRPIRLSIRASGLLAAALLGLGLPAPADGCAPAPCITGNPNPVVLQPGQTEGTTLLDWNAGGAGLAQPTLVILVANQIVATYSVQAQGTRQLSVEVGKTYTVRLLLKDRAGEELLAAVEIPVKGKLHIPGPEQIGTVTNVRVIAHGTWVELHFTAPFPSQAAVWISRNAPQGNSEQGLDVVRYAPAVGSHQFQHVKKLYDIAPGTRFYYLIRAISQNGLRAHASGSFMTKKRVATIQVGKVKVIDDSDELSAGDLIFGFYINPGRGFDFGDAFRFFPSNTSTTINVDSGDFVTTTGVELVLSDAGDSLDFNVTGFDSDSSSCGSGAISALNGVSNNSCGDKSGKTETYPLTPTGPGQEEYTRSFQLDAGYAPGGTLKLRAYGTLRVAYVN